MAYHFRCLSSNQQRTRHWTYCQNCSYVLKTLCCWCRRVGSCCFSAHVAALLHTPIIILIYLRNFPFPILFCWHLRTRSIYHGFFMPVSHFTLMVKTLCNFPFPTELISVIQRKNYFPPTFQIFGFSIFFINSVWQNNGKI